MDLILCIILIILAIPLVKYLYDYSKKTPSTSILEKEEEIYEPSKPTKIKIEKGTVSKCIGVSHCHADIGTITALQVVSSNYKIIPFKKVSPDIQNIVATKLRTLTPKITKHFIFENWTGSDIMYVMISKDDTFIGTVGVDRKNFDPYISHLYVDPLFRNKGYGERLLEHGIEYSRLFKFESIKLWCVESLIPYYSSKGWVQEKLSKDNNDKEVWVLSFELK
jgi:predicted GNAT family acetyltransferase